MFCQQALSNQKDKTMGFVFPKLSAIANPDDGEIYMGSLFPDEPIEGVKLYLVDGKLYRYDNGFIQLR